MNVSSFSDSFKAKCFKEGGIDGLRLELLSEIPECLSPTLLYR